MPGIHTAGQSFKPGSRTVPLTLKEVNWCPMSFRSFYTTQKTKHNMSAIFSLYSMKKQTHRYSHVHSYGLSMQTHHLNYIHVMQSFLKKIHKSLIVPSSAEGEHIHLNPSPVVKVAQQPNNWTTKYHFTQKIDITSTEWTIRPCLQTKHRLAFR